MQTNVHNIAWWYGLIQTHMDKNKHKGLSTPTRSIIREQHRNASLGGGMGRRREQRANKSYEVGKQVHRGFDSTVYIIFAMIKRKNRKFKKIKIKNNNNKINQFISLDNLVVQTWMVAWGLISGYFAERSGGEDYCKQLKYLKYRIRRALGKKW